MAKHDDEAMMLRHEAIFKAGAEASSPSWPKFEGEPLGSMEGCTWYDGYASTHPEFKNPYRIRR
jgi:uncharacterized protein YodC (DUF2158 family)